VKQYYPALPRPTLNFASPISVAQVANATNACDKNTVVSQFYLNFCNNSSAPVLQGIVPWCQTFSGYDCFMATLIIKNQLIPRYTGDKPTITVTVDQLQYVVNGGDTIYIPLNSLSSNFAISAQCTNQFRSGDTFIPGNPDCLIYITSQKYSSAYLRRRGTPPALCTYTESVSSQSYMSIGSDASQAQGYAITDVNGNLLSNTNQNFIITPDVFFGWSFAPVFDTAAPFPLLGAGATEGDVELFWIKATVPCLMDFSDDPNETGAPLHGYATASYVDPGGTGATRYLQEYWATLNLDYYTGFSPAKLELPLGEYPDYLNFFALHPIQCSLPVPGGGKGQSWPGGSGHTADIRAQFPFYFYNSSWGQTTGPPFYLVPKNPIVVSVASTVFIY
jgi:hypothetical protein